MILRDSPLRAAAALAVCAAALLVAGCGGGGGKGGAKVVGGSNNTSVCAYTRRFGRGRVYVEIAVSPVSLKSTACSAFNRSFGGRSFGGRAPILPAGTGRPHCGYSKRGSSYRIELGVFSSPTREPDTRSAARSTPATASGATFSVEAAAVYTLHRLKSDCDLWLQSARTREETPGAAGEDWGEIGGGYAYPRLLGVE
jgi:hypothetical protein